MSYQPFLIANQRVGTQTNQDPWLLADDAYPSLLNTYLYRGTLKKAGGNISFGRLGVRNDTAPYSAALVVRAGAPQVYATNTLVAPIEPGSMTVSDGVTTFTDNGGNGLTGALIVTSGSGTNGTINYTTGAFTVTFNALNNGAKVTARYHVVVGANSPAMGLCTYDIEQISNDSLIGFDLTDAYLYNNAIQDFIDISTYKISTGQTTANLISWHGTNSQFFSYENIQGAFFATNNVPGNHFYAITAVVTGATTQITTAIANNFSVGDVAYFNNIQQTAGTFPSRLNNHQGVVTIAGNPFTVAINTAGDVYTANSGIAWEQTKSAAPSGTPGIFNDGIRWYDGTGWVNFTPPLGSNGLSPLVPPTYPTILQGGLLLFAYKGRLVVLSTWEGLPGVAPTNFQQRARWSQNGTVFYGATLPVSGPATVQGSSWFTQSGLGGFVDAPTGEVIVSAEFIKDTLVVYFERSTYRLNYTGNSAFPFEWQKINTEIGTESTWSIVPFDREILSVGPNGIYDCDSINIERIDQIIPDRVFQFGNANNGIARVQGIREFYSQFAYWTFVNPPTSQLFPDAILSYNYIDKSFAILAGSYTCFGHYQTVENRIWNNTMTAWEDMDEPWNSAALQGQFPIVVAGNQQGFVMRLNLTSDDDNQKMTNDPTLVIQNVTNAVPSVFTVPNHNLALNSFIILQNVDPAVNGNVYYVQNVTTNTFTLLDSNFNPVTVTAWVFGGTVTTVSGFELKTKKFTPFMDAGQKIRVGYIDLFLENNNDVDAQGNYPEFTMQLLPNEGNFAPVEKRVSLRDTFDATSSMFWKRVYLNQTCQSFSLNMNPGTTAAGIFNQNNASSTFEIHGMILWMAPAGRVVR